MEKKLTPWGWFECDFWVDLGSGVFHFSSSSQAGIFIQQEYNSQMPESIRNDSGIYSFGKDYYLAVAAFHSKFDMDYLIFDEETVQQAHLAMNCGEQFSSAKFNVDDLIIEHINAIKMVILLLIETLLIL